MRFPLSLGLIKWGLVISEFGGISRKSQSGAPRKEVAPLYFPGLRLQFIWVALFAAKAHIENSKQIQKQERAASQG